MSFTAQSDGKSHRQQRAGSTWPICSSNWHVATCCDSFHPTETSNIKLLLQILRWCSGIVWKLENHNSWSKIHGLHRGRLMSGAYSVISCSMLGLSQSETYTTRLVVNYSGLERDVKSTYLRLMDAWIFFLQVFLLHFFGLFLKTSKHVVSSL